MIVTAVTQRGLRLDDLKQYTIGGIVDYITTWNNIMSPGERTEPVKEATTDDIKRFKSM